MTRPMVRVSDGENVIDREMTDEEFAQYEIDLAANKKREADELARETAKAALLTKLGITADEAKLLLG